MGLSMLFAASTAAAQVDKRVEVTKDYQPVVAGAVKLPITPDMSDTTKMRPEIDYTITPLMYSTELVTVHSFRPAKITYWDFNRPTNFYLKLGVGYPVNTVGDFFMSTHNVRTGYLMAAATHYGEFGKRVNDFDFSRKAMRASTRGRVAGGVYWGSHMFEGELSYGNENSRRYAAPVTLYATDGSEPSLGADFEDFTLKLRLGDDFVDLTRTNFNVELTGAYFHDKSDWLAADYNLQQFDFGGAARVGRSFRRHYVEADARFSGNHGIKDLRSVSNTVWAGLRYGYKSNTVDLLAGADFAYEWGGGAQGKSHILPYLKLLLNVTDNGAFIPFIEAEGTLQSNDYYSLARHTVYVGFSDAISSLPTTLDYDFRAGFTGKFGRGRFGYRLSAGMSFTQNELYWYNFCYEWLGAVAARANTVSVGLELDYRPVDDLILSAGVHARFFKDFAELNGVEMANGKSPFDAYFKLRYKHRKFSVGASAKFCSAADWTSVEPVGDMTFDSFDETTPMYTHNVRMPSYVDLGVDFEWKINSDWRVFVEGTNLANMKIYNWAYFREQGIRCTAGFKFTF